MMKTFGFLVVTKTTCWLLTFCTADEGITGTVDYEPVTVAIAISKNIPIFRI